MTAELVNIKPSGHRAIASRQYTQNDIELSRICSEWLNLDGAYSLGYANAQSMVSGKKMSVEEVIALLNHPMIFSHENYDRIGTFISAVHNYCVPDNIIVWEEQTPNLTCLGYQSEKLIINRGSIGGLFGIEARGVIVNLGLTDGNFGLRARGVVLHASTFPQPLDREYGINMSGLLIHDSVGKPSSSAPYKIHVADRRIYRGNHHRVLSEHDAREIKRLERVCERSPDEIMKEYGENPAETIKKMFTSLFGVYLP
jgi:hypothetical protein